uniref:Zinc finger, C2HC-type containing 1C n=1 Tax=Iconisemion striatum TaxID=60296 RepID=A0A1A7WQC7_9TELE
MIKTDDMLSSCLPTAPSWRQDSQEQQSIAGRSQVQTHSQCRTVSNKKKDQVEELFPIKPVIHRRQPQTQVLFGFEKITPSTQQRGHVMHQDYHSADIRETRPLHSQLPNGELLMTRAIQEKELLLLEKLWKVGEKIKAIQINSPDAAAGHDHKRGDGKHDIGPAEWGEVHTKPTVSEYQRRELLDNRDVLDKSFDDDLKQRKRQDQMNEDGFRNKYEVQQFRWDVRKHESDRVPRKVELQKVNEPFGRRDEKIYGVWEDMDEKYREQNEACQVNTTWTREKKHKESMHSPGDKFNMHQKSLQKSEQALANQRSTTLPLLSQHSSVQHQVEPELSDAAASSFQQLPCNLCNRMFRSERLEKHIQICAKVNLKQRQIFNSSTQRSKGSQLEEYLKTHVRIKTPEVLKKKKKKKL